MSGNFGSSKGAVCDGDEHVTLLRLVYFRGCTKRPVNAAEENDSAIQPQSTRRPVDMHVIFPALRRRYFLPVCKLTANCEISYDYKLKMTVEIQSTAR